MRRRALLQTGSTVALASVAGCAAFSGDADFETWTPDEEWPLDAFGPRNTAYSRLAAPPRSEPDRVASDDAGSRIRSLVAGGNTVVVGTDDGVDAYDPDLEPEWNVADGGKAVAVRDGTVYAAGHADAGTAVHAHSLADGSRRWRTTDDAQSELTHVVPTRGAVLVADSTLTVFSPSNGARKWSHVAPAPIHPALGDETTYFAATGLHALSLRSGVDELLNGPVGTTELLDTPRIRSRLTAAGGRLYFAVRFPNQPAAVVAFDDDGEQWRAPLGVSGYSGQAVDGGACYATGYETGDAGYGGGVVGAYTLGDGAERWQKRTDGWLHAPVLAGGDGTAETVLAYGGGPRDGGTIHAFDARDGDRLWSVETATPVDAVAPVGERVYAGARDGAVFALA